ncbi:MAG: helix-turn-helix domain-containing protein [Rhodocyclales bacterium]|nr:helix-turn-helix domain-containing protein [Rhodocyclales bacterium]
MIHVARDVDEQAANLGRWAQRYQQLTPGRFEGNTIEAWFDGVQIFREILKQSVHQEGQPWPGSIAFGLPIAMDGNSNFCGDAMQQNSVIVVHDGSDFAFRTARMTDVIAVALNLRELAEYARDVEGFDILAEIKGRHLVSAAEVQVEELRRFLLSVLGTLQSDPAVLSHAAARKSLETVILGRLIAMLRSASAGQAQLAVPYSRRQIVEMARDYILAHVEDPLTVADVCVALGVSRRTLQYSFHDVFDISPVKYLKVLRLNGARRDLKNGWVPETSVQDVAAKWGFWHLGHFATDYKRMFDETPSATLYGKPQAPMAS